MIVQAVRERLSSELADTFRIVEGAIGLASVKGRPDALPAAYVITPREASEENSLATGQRQLVQTDITVVIVTENLTDPRGQATADEIDLLKAEVRKALLGWEPEDAVEPITHVSGRLATVREGVAWWEETFATSYFLEA